MTRRTSATRRGDRRRAHPVLPLEHALCRPVEPRHDDGGAQRPGRQYGLKGEHIDEVVGGAVVTHSKDFNLAREAVLGTKLAPSTPGITMMQACGTSLQAALDASAAKIATGEIESGIAMGSDTTSDAPIVFSKKFAHRLVERRSTPSRMEQAQGVQGLLAGRAGAAAARRRRAAHGPVHGPALPS